MANETILVVDDDAQIRILLRDRLQGNNFNVILAENGKEGLKLAFDHEPDLVLLDLQMPEMDGLSVLKQLKQQKPEVTVIILTAFGSIERAVEAMKFGAYDFLPKPCKPAHILMVIRKALERKGLKEENRYLRAELDQQYQMVLGKSPAMKQVIEMAQKVAPGKTTVLIGGESGTGKQLLARAIHKISDRHEKPFIQITCTTLSEQLMESDLFGHEKGAFTGAVSAKKGRFELADKGTVFLDEIGDISPAIQAKLLHVLEYGEFQRVGGLTTIKCDVRIIAATNKNLLDEVKKGIFREDLFYRLNVMLLKLPSLRERSEDIPEFANYFLKKHSRAMQKNPEVIEPDALEILQSYSWPGNIRELENVIERAVVLATGKALSADLLPLFTPHNHVNEIAVGLPLDEAIAKFKKQFITHTLHSTQNNQTKAAEILKIQRTYLNRLIRELGI